LHGAGDDRFKEWAKFVGQDLGHHLVYHMTQSDWPEANEGLILLFLGDEIQIRVIHPLYRGALYEDILCHLHYLSLYGVPTRLEEYRWKIVWPML